MSALDLMMAASGEAANKLYVDDVFSIKLRNGTGQTVSVFPDIDLYQGFMSWTKSLSDVSDYAVYDSARGVCWDIASNTASAATDQAGGLQTISRYYYNIGSLQKMNKIGSNFVDWIFRRAPKFFDVVTYTGNGVAGRQISHSLGVQAGFVIVKATSTTGDWNSYHRSATGDLKLNLADAQTASRAVVTAADASTFTVSGVANTNGVQYVAYLFAHDPSAEGFVQCGSYVGNGSSNGPVVNLGWEPQYVMIKNVNRSSNWWIIDAARGFSETTSFGLSPNVADAELTNSNFLNPTSAGFQSIGAGTGNNANGETHIYLAIRRSNKPPISGTQVYRAIARTGDSAVNQIVVGFPTDFWFTKSRSAQQKWVSGNRLVGLGRHLTFNSTAEEVNYGTPTTIPYDQNSLMYGDFGVNNPPLDATGTTYIDHFFRRASGFFDVVTYTGDGTSGRQIAHNLGVMPELVICKGRNNVRNWQVSVYDSSSIGGAKTGSSSAHFGFNTTNKLDPTVYPSAFNQSWFNPIQAFWSLNQTGENYVAYLFASLPGISKVGSYTGNGAGQTINCGFSTGARFVLIKRTDAAGDWYVWDTVRGIVADNDPYLSLNTIAAEVTTDDSIDPASVGFNVYQTAATNINVNGGSYIYLSVS